MPAAKTCPRCGTPQSADLADGLCPRCLLQGVMGNPATVGYDGAFSPPSIEELNPLFPSLEIIELIGQGGMGAVYKARHTTLDRLVALKVLPRESERDPAFAERFAREAQALAKLTHPNIVAVHDTGEAGGFHYLVMEYVAGVNLRQAMRDGSLTPLQAMAIVPQICEALQYAHDNGIVHRDIKPENILLGVGSGLSAFSVKIADFGLAKLLARTPAQLTLTADQQVMGTLHYMAPEQMERPLTVDHRADIYALGVVFYELLTGELPLGRFDPPSLKAKIDVRLDEVVLRALAREPDRRYQAANDVRSALAAILAGGGWARTMTFREYRSKRTLFGWPLVHIVSGRDPLTGRAKVAMGWLAIGDSGAVGVIALAGGWAAGGIAVAGGGSIGILALAGGFTFAILALAGGVAGGLLVAVAGGMALSGGLAIAGGFAIGQFAIGSSAAGNAVLSATRQDPDFSQRVGTWLGWLGEHLWPF